jgi:large repetitive protein
VTLSAASGRTVTVTYATADGSATAPSDYTSRSGEISFAPGQTSLPLPIVIREDVVHEADEFFLLNLLGAVNASLGSAQGIGTIHDDDPDPATVQATISDVTVAEGASGTASAVFVVSISSPATQVVKVDYATTAGTAEGGSDYTAKPGTLTFQVGQTTKTVSVLVKGDLNEEPDETFRVNLSNPQGLTIVDGQGVGTIANDDGPPEISIADKAITEGYAGSKTVTLTLTVSLSATTYEPVTVSYATAEAGSGAGFATSDVDYVAGSGILTINPGQKTGNIIVAIKGDQLAEGPETFLVNLSSPTNATLGDAQAVGTILDNKQK